jgi:VanZ family protein
MLGTVLKVSAWLGLFVILIATVVSIDLRPNTVLHVNVERAGAFALISALFVSAYPKYWKLLAFVVIASAFGFELLQVFSDTRHARLSDAVIKALGAIVGIIMGRLINAQLVRRSR